MKLKRLRRQIKSIGEKIENLIPYQLEKMNKDYFLGVHQKELERLHRQHLAWQPEMQDLIHTANLPNCQTILDLGCGPGFTTFELANNCPNSEITALDKAALYQKYLHFQIQKNKAKNVKPLHADILELSQQEGLYEAAFCRWFLAFLIADLPAVLKNVYEKLKPGGVFAMMEYLTLDSFTCSPPNKSFDAYVKAWNHFYWNNGGDATIGTYLPKLLEEAGFEVEIQKCVGGMSPAGHRWWNWWRDAFDNFAPTFVEQSLMTANDFEVLKNYWEEQTDSGKGFIYSAIILQIVARKK